MDDLRVTFEFTVDEAAEVQSAFVKTSREASSWRRREQFKFVVSLTIACAFVVIIFRDNRSISNSAFLIAVAFGIGLLLAIPFGWYYDHIVRTRRYRFLLEQLGGLGPHQCSIEIRPTTLWVSQAGVELTFRWSDATNVQDITEGVAITFSRGLVLARNRGFISDAHRAAFLRHVRERASITPASPPSAG